MTRELLVIKILASGLRTRDIATGESASLKTGVSFEISEMDTINFEVEKEWSFNKQKYASGNVLDHRLILSNIKVSGLEYESVGIWDPYEMFGEEAGEYFPEYIKEGYRESYVFKDYSGYGFYEQDEDPVSDAVDLKEMGERRKAYDKLTKLWEDYPQCIDALVHIGNMHFDGEDRLRQTYNCYKSAVEIAERNMPKDLDGIFLWGCIENRPYLRALKGLCLILWRQKSFEESYEISKKLLRMCPTDNMGIRFIIDMIKNHDKWTDDI